MGTGRAGTRIAFIPLGMKRFLFLISAVSVFGATAQAPDAQAIVRRSTAAIEADWNQAPKYSYIERDVESKRGSKPIVKTYEVLMIEGSPYNRLLATDDKALSQGEQAEEEQKLRAAIEKRQHESKRERAKRIAKYEKERNQDHAMLKEMVDAFDFRLAGEENVGGHDCWVFDASPKRGYQPPNHQAKVLTGMRGKLWVDKRQEQWVKVEAEVFKPVSFYGFFAKVGPGTRFELEQEPVAGDLWLPKRFSMNVSASTFGFISQNAMDDETYRDYKPMSRIAELQARK